MKGTDYLTHPIDDNLLLVIVRNALNSAHQEKQLDKMIITVSEEETICSEGDDGAQCFFIKSGKVKIVQARDNGADVVLTELGVGEIFGEMALVNTRPRSASVIALERTELYVLNKDNFAVMIEQKPGFALKLVQTLCNRLEKASATYVDGVLMGSGLAFKHLDSRIWTAGIEMV